MLLEIHLIDSATGILKGLRGITLTPELTRRFLLAVQDQLSGAGDAMAIYRRYSQTSLETLAKQANMARCGES
jgi:hypothetical protein